MDQELRQEALDFFLEMLSELKPLDLWGDGNMSLLLDKSFHSVARFLDEIVSSSDVDKTMKSKAIKILLGFGLARGSLSNLLLVTDILLGRDPTFDIPISDELKLLGNEIPDLKLSYPASNACLLSSSTNALSDIVTSAAEGKGKGDKVDKRDFCAMAADGKYLYIHGKHGLAKIGTGFHGTIEGHLYAINKEYRGKEKGWLCCVKDKLYYRSTEITPKPFLVINPDTLEEDTTIDACSIVDDAFFISEQSPSGPKQEGQESSRTTR
jgi:hypothetical protein